MRLLIILSSIFLWTDCKPTVDNKPNTKWSIVGSWYTDLQDRPAPNESFPNYCEIYISDSTLYYQEEEMGQGMEQAYFISNDTIYKCYTSHENCKYIPMYKIDNFKNDTLWLTINKEYTKRDNKVFWVKFSDDEKGHYEHSWTKENSDSLGFAVGYDYDRRRYRYYATLGNRLDRYDSALNAGMFKWDMTEEHIRQTLERRRKRAR